MVGNGNFVLEDSLAYCDLLVIVGEEIKILIKCLDIVVTLGVEFGKTFDCYIVGAGLYEIFCCVDEVGERHGSHLREILVEFTKFFPFILVAECLHLHAVEVQVVLVDATSFLNTCVNESVGLNPIALLKKGEDGFLDFLHLLLDREGLHEIF